MQLRLESRPVGDVLVMQCNGRIVAENEVFTLHANEKNLMDLLAWAVQRRVLGA